MKKPIEIEKKGSYFKLDEEGYFINPASKDKIQEKWSPLIKDIINMYKEMYGEDKLVSVYIRGSVAKGEAIDGVSDLDTITYVDLPKVDIKYDWIDEKEKEFLEKYPFCTGIELGADALEAAKEDQFLIGQSALVYGKDLQESKIKLDENILIHSKKFNKTMEWFENKLKEDLPQSERINACVWMSKQFLRTGMELCVLRSQKYSRDLYLCWEQFSYYYPEKSDDMYELLNLALNPISDSEKIKGLNKDWTKWFKSNLN